jgi:hypothetical protein
VLGAGHEGRLRLDDLALRTHYSLGNAAAHAITMTSLAFGELAAAHPQTSFVHSHPGGVQTNITRNLHPMVRGLIAGVARIAGPFLGAIIVPVKDCGERHVYAATSPRFRPKQSGGSATPARADNAEVGIDGVRGSGAYAVHLDSSAAKRNEVLKEYVGSGVGKKVWEHTLAEFARVQH